MKRFTNLFMCLNQINLIKGQGINFYFQNSYVKEIIELEKIHFR
jgi:hypothetical protein